MGNQKHQVILDQEILKTLTDNLPDMLWIKDNEGHYLFANQSICDNLLMAKDTNEPIGKNDVFFALRERATQPQSTDWHTFGELCHNSDDATIKENRPMRFEEYGNVKGKLLYLEVHKAPFYDKEGHIIGVVGSARDITEMVLIKQKIEEQKSILEYQANHDSLTDLPNRMLFQDRLEQALLKSERNKQVVALFFIDLDHFKDINDVYGHDCGDKVLTVIAQRIKRITRKTDTLARLGGDEFTLIIEQVGDISKLSVLAHKLLSIIKMPIVVDTTRHHISASIGISLNHNSIDSSSIVKHADSAMYRAKDLGRNRFEFYSNDLTEKAFKRVMLERELRTALKEEQFDVFFQPKINLQSFTISGVEALIRWHHPKLGLLSPDSFIPCAEESGLIIELDRWVYQYSLHKLKQWTEKGIVSHFKMAMNLSTCQLEKTDFVDYIANLINENELDTACIELEITETQLMQNIEKNMLTLQKLKELGIRLAMDDFGTGYSSLAYLKQLQMDTLKIDRSFIADVPTEEDDTSIVLAILAMAKSLGLQVVAEGVETKTQLNFLKKEHCQYVQGYLFSKPLNTDDLEALLIRQTDFCAELELD